MMTQSLMEGECYALGEAVMRLGKASAFSKFDVDLEERDHTYNFTLCVEEKRGGFTSTSRHVNIGLLCLVFCNQVLWTGFRTS